MFLIDPTVVHHLFYKEGGSVEGTGPDLFLPPGSVSMVADESDPFCVRNDKPPLRKTCAIIQTLTCLQEWIQCICHLETAPHNRPAKVVHNNVQLSNNNHLGAKSH